MSKLSGVGLGLRWEFVDELLLAMPSSLDFLEVAPENYIGRGGYHSAALHRFGARYPLLTHGLTMSLGGVDPLDKAYLLEVQAFVRSVKAPWHSDHLCFGAAGGRIVHDLLPIVFTDPSAQRVADRIRHAQDVLKVPLAFENISFYLEPGKSEMGEAEFIAKVCDKADCGWMFDVNNAYVNSSNFGFDLGAWIRTVPLERVVQMHVAGGEWLEDEDGRVLLDTHGAETPEPVLALLGEVLKRTGAVPVVLERDQNIPKLDNLLREIATIRAVYDAAVSA